MSAAVGGALAELHVHLYGCIRPEAFQRHLTRGAEIDWEPYREVYQAAFGWRPDPGALVERLRAGDPRAAGELRELLVFGDADGGSFERFQAKFDLLIAASELSRLARGRGSESALEKEVDTYMGAVLRDQAEGGVGHLELRMMPPAGAGLELTRRLLERMLDHAEQGADRLGIDATIALSLPREDPWPMWELVGELCRGAGGERLSAVDFCAVEEGHPPKRKAAFFEALRAHNEADPERALAILYHVSESFEDKSLESALRWVQEAAELGAHRLGHALALGIDPDHLGPHTRSEPAGERADQLRYDLRHNQGLARHGVRVDREAAVAELARLETYSADRALETVYDPPRLHELRKRQNYAMECVRRSGAVIEVCPTSNRRIAGLVDDAHHPIHRFLEADLPVVIGSDDPGIFDTTLRAELDWVRRTAGLAPEQMTELVRRGWECRSGVLVGRG